METTTMASSHRKAYFMDRFEAPILVRNHLSAENARTVVRGKHNVTSLNRFLRGSTSRFTTLFVPKKGTVDKDRSGQQCRRCTCLRPDKNDRAFGRIQHPVPLQYRSTLHAQPPSGELTRDHSRSPSAPLSRAMKTSYRG